MYKPIPPDLNDDAATIHGAIIAEGPISKARSAGCSAAIAPSDLRSQPTGSARSG